MSVLTRLSAHLVRSWTRLYTVGVPAELKRQRRAELESDLWEHLAAASEAREPALRTAVHLLARLAAGVPADLIWRLQAPRLATESTLVMEAALVFGARRRAWPRRSWLDRNLWVVPAVLLFLLLTSMWLLMSSTRPSRLSFDVRAPAHLHVTDGKWRIQAVCCSWRGPAIWPEQRTYIFRVTNQGPRTAYVRIEGFDQLPQGFAYRYGAAPVGSAEALRASNGLFAAYNDRMRGARDPVAESEAFAVEELQEFLSEWGSYFGLDPQSMGEPFRRMGHTMHGTRSWLAQIPASPICTAEQNMATVDCSDALSVPPGAMIDVAVVITAPPDSEEGIVKTINLTLVDDASP